MPSVFITPSVVKEATEILDKYFGAGIAALCGEDVAGTDAWKLALGLGIADPTKPPDLDLMHTFGVFLTHVEHAGGDERGHGQYGTTIPEFMEAIEKNPVPRLSSEFHAGEHARRHAATHLRGLGNKVGARLGSKLIEADQELAAFMRQQVNDALGAKYGDADAQARLRARAGEQGKPEDFYDDAFRGTIKRVRSDMGHLTNDWSRDWDRIAQTETQNAINTGLVDGWQEREKKQAAADKRPPQRLLAYKVPRPGACKHCIRLHMSGGYPRIFHLDEIVGNGNNIGRKADDWQVVMGATHPFCACPLFRLPKVIIPPQSWSSGQPLPDIVDTDGRLA